MLWKTFSNPAAQLLIPFNDLKHEIYRKNLKEALTDVKEVFCDEYASPLEITTSNINIAKET